MTPPYPADLYPGCPCHACDSPTWQVIRMGAFDVPMARMSLCPTCGNKRCPGAVNHTNPCGGSNAPGQPGSFYAGDIATPPAVCTRCQAAINATSTDDVFTWATITGNTTCPDGKPHQPDNDSDLPTT